MLSIDLKLFKKRLGEYVRLAAGGETVLITDGDRVMAELVPPRPRCSRLLADAMLTDAVRAGWLTPSVRVGAGPPPRRPVAAFRDLIDELHRDRDGR
jgi:antitoxin (DNA-binding transcriptional repressor) of toxin-antitoxin stability system